MTIEAVRQAHPPSGQEPILSSCRLSMSTCFCCSVMLTVFFECAIPSGVTAEGVAAADVVFAGGSGKLATTSESNDALDREAGCFLTRCGGMAESCVDKW